MPQSVDASEADMNQPRLKSALQEYSMMYDEIQKEKVSLNCISKKILEPKMDYINDVLAQHLLQKEYTETFRNLQAEVEACKEQEQPRVFSEKCGELRELLMKAFYRGKEEEFFKIREKIYEELNYFTLDYKLDDKLEIRLRAYFLVYHLIPINKKSVILLDSGIHRRADEDD